MWGIIRTILVSIIVAAITLIAVNRDNIYTRPESPPMIYRSLFENKPPTPEAVEKYQEDLLTYIQYLENHYISVGLYYDGKKELPIFQSRNDNCRLFEFTFKEINLPILPIGESDLDPELIIHRLAEDVIQLRARIKEHNAYIGELKRYYKPCYEPQ